MHNGQYNTPFPISVKRLPAMFVVAHVPTRLAAALEQKPLLCQAVSFGADPRHGLFLWGLVSWAGDSAWLDFPPDSDRIFILISILVVIFVEVPWDCDGEKNGARIEAGGFDRAKGRAWGRREFTRCA
jgi:hypothetical protein